ncbi:mitochondrial import receptor subunit tom20 [Batrachochytrium dendrobatidis]
MTETLSLGRVFTAAAAFAAVGVLGYAIYFDYRRNTSPEFRKKSVYQQRAAQKIRSSRAAQVQAAAAATRRAQGGADSSTMFELEDEPLPTNAQDAQAYFSKHLMMGETLLSRGPAGYEAAAVCFYRALKVHPEAVMIFEAFEKSLPGPVLDLIVQLMSADVRSAQPDAEKGATVEEVE